MRYVSPLDGVSVLESDSVPAVQLPVRSGSGWQANSTECAFQAECVGEFHVCNGDTVTYAPVPGADPEWVRLYLNSQVLVALLHQRKIINFHASSFVYNGMGVMVLGETGAGKSSLTLAFALHEGGFLTDDLTPLVFDGSAPRIMPLHRNVKLRKDTAVQLGIDPSRLSEAESGTGKKYLSLQPVQQDPFHLDVIIRVETAAISVPAFITPAPAERFALLRSEVCSWEILAGMPETEAAYLAQLSAIVRHTEFVRIERPSEISINHLFASVKEWLNGLQGRGEK